MSWLTADPDEYPLALRGFFPLLVLLLALFVAQPAVSGHAEGEVAVSLIFYVAMLAAIHASGLGRSFMLAGLAISTLAFVTRAVDEAFDVSALAVPSDAINPALVFFVIFALLARVARDEQITMNTVFGAVCGYFLLGLFWAFVYVGMEKAEPGTFSFPEALDGDVSERLAELIYFSFVTITTLGYGDITPVRDVARSLVVLEAFIGQVYLVVLVARLVSLAYTARGDRMAGGPPPPARPNPTKR